MKPIDILSQLAKHNIRVSVNGDKLSVDAPVGAVTAPLAALIRDNKPALMAFLTEQAGFVTEKVDARPLVASTRAADGVYPLSFAQKRMWFLDVLDKAGSQAPSGQYNLPMVYQVNGPFDVEIAERALCHIIEQHPILRSVIVEKDEEPCLKVLPDWQFKIERFDVCHLPVEQRETQAKGIAHGILSQGFALDSELMVRAGFVLMSDRADELSGILAIAVHHIAADGWSMGLLMNAFNSAYQALNKGQLPAPTKALQYIDFIAWQQRYLAGDNLARQLSYWQQQLDDAPMVHSLPLEGKRSEDNPRKAGVVQGRVDKSYAQPLKQLAKQHGLTDFMLIHGALAIVLARHSATADVVIGTPVANRTVAGAEDIIGLFVNSLVLRANVGAQSLADYFGHIRKLNLDAQANQDVPFEQLVEHLKVTRSTSHMPLFQILLAMNNTDSAIANSDVNAQDTESSAFDGLNFKRISGGEISAKFELSINAGFDDNGVQLSWVYDKSLFSQTQVSTFNCHLENILISLCQGNNDLSELSMLSEQERQFVLYQRNVHDYERSADVLLHQRFEALAASQADKLAVIGLGQNLSYAELNSKANRLAAKLQSAGVDKGEVVALYLSRSEHFLTAMLAVLKAGGAYLPLDLSQPLERLSFILEDSGAVTMLALSERLPACELSQNRTLVCLDEFEQSPQYMDFSPHNIAPSNRVDALAYICYTSGSTGQPKGVMIAHKNVTHLVMDDPMSKIAQNDIVSWAANPAFDASVWEVWSALSNGATIALVAADVLLDPVAFAAFLAQHQVTVVQLTSGLLTQYAEPLSGAFSRLRMLSFGGDKADMSAIRHIFEHGRPQTLVHTYGPTETTVYTMGCEVNELLLAQEQLPIGFSLPGTQSYVLDLHGQPAPLGACGELLIGGRGVGIGYLNRPELNQQAFIDDTFGADANSKLYRSGDTVKLKEDGAVLFVGRGDGQVKIRGFRIELGEIQQKLDKLEAVESSLVSTFTDGSGEKQIVAYVVSTQSEEALKAALVCQLPEYMMPSAVVPLQSWPLTANGKIDRRALPSPAERTIDGAIVEPVNGTEAKLVSIWANLLGLDAERISTEADFFVSGGHSLLAIRLVAQIRVQFARELSIRDIFSATTIKAQAHKILTCDSSHLRPQVVATGRDKTMPVVASFGQKRLWFVHQRQGRSPEYNMPSAFAVYGEFSPEIAEQAMMRIIARHDVLRTVFYVDGEQTLQRMLPSYDFKLSRVEIALPPGDARDNVVKQHLSADSVESFDLSADLMVRGSYFAFTQPDSIDEPCGVLLLNIHHIASDGWSMALLFEEFMTHYQDIEQNRPDSLPELVLQYGDYALWQNQLLSSDIYPLQLDYWQQQLAGAPLVHSLPLARERQADNPRDGAEVLAQIDEATATALEQLAKAHGMTLFMLLQGTLALVLGRHSGTRDIVMGLPVANRLQGELEPLIGLFVNTLVLRLDTTERELSDYLNHVKEVHLAAQANQDVPFEQLVEQCKVARNPLYSPLFQIQFRMNNTQERPLKAQQRLRFSALPEAHVAAKYELNINARHTEGGITFGWTYDLALFDAKQISTMAGHWCTLLASLAQTSEQASQSSTKALSMMSKAEVEHLVFALNQTEQPYPQQLCLHQWFEQQVEATPDAPALIFDARNIEGQSYRELNQKANRLAHYLLSQGVKANDVVGLCFERSYMMVEAMLAVLKVGGCYVAIDAAQPPLRIEHVVNDSGVATILCQSGLDERMAKLGFGESLKCIDSKEVKPQIAAQPLDNLDVTISPDALAYIVYTSGSTGMPKGVRSHHRGAVNYLDYIGKTWQLGAKDKVLQLASYAFDASVRDIFGPLCHGASVVLLSRDNSKDAKAMLAAIEYHQVSCIASIVPSMLDALVAQIEPQHNLSSLRLVLCSGEALSEALSKKVFERVGNEVELVNQYGPTETTMTATYQRVNDITAVDGKMPVGRPIQNMAVYLLDESLALAPFGALGEVYFAGVGLAQGYHNQPLLSQSSFVEVELPGSGLTRLYKTGDRARYLADGTLVFAGRLDSQVKVRGNRVELGEVARAVSQCDGIAEAVVTTFDNEQGVVSLVAYIELDSDVTHLTSRFSDGLRQQLKASLSEYMLPSKFVVVEQWPRTPNGKIDKKALAQSNGRELKAEFVAPRNANERILQQVWAKVLELPQGSIGVKDNFFELGGHSLLLLNLIFELAQNHDWQLGINDIYEYQSIEALAAKRSDEVGSEAIGNVIALSDNRAEINLFAFHPIFGRADLYHPLAQAIADKANLYGVQAACLSQFEFRFDDMPQLAAFYIEQMQLVQPQGPYYLAGWSAGGQIAAYVAMALKAAGEQVAYLAVLDSAIPQTDPYASTGKGLRAFYRMVFGNTACEQMTRFDTMVNACESDEDKLSGVVEFFSGLGLSEFANPEHMVIYLKAAIDYFAAKRPVLKGPLADNARLAVSRYREQQTEFCQDWFERLGEHSAVEVLGVEHDNMLKPQGLTEVIELFQQDLADLAAGKALHCAQQQHNFKISK